MDIATFVNNDLFLFLAVGIGAIIIVSSASTLLFPTNVAKARLSNKSTRAKSKLNLRQDTEEDGVFQSIGRLVTPKSKNKQSKLRETLSQAGYRNKSAVVAYYAIRVATALGLAVLATILTSNVGISIAGCFLGFALPAFILSSKIKNRTADITSGFSDALDLLLICVEAGLSFNAALNKVTAELASSQPIISEEFAIICNEIRAGKSRADALTGFSHRTDITEITSFVTVVNQSDKYGTSVADSLRVYSSEMRQKRILLIEEKAHKLPVKLSLAVATITMPVMMLLFLVPALAPVLKWIGS